MPIYHEEQSFGAWIPTPCLKLESMQAEVCRFIRSTDTYLPELTRAGLTQPYVLQPPLLCTRWLPFSRDTGLTTTSTMAARRRFSQHMCACSHRCSS